MREFPLSELLETVIDHRGKTPRKLGGDFVDAGVPVISAIHIKNGVIQWSERERYVSPEMFAKWMPVRLQENDVLLTSEAPLGETALVPTSDDLVLSQRLFALRGKSETLDNRYLRYFLASATGQERLLERATGTTVLGIRQAELLKVLVPLPPLDEQRRIAGVLGALDDLIEVNRRLVANLRGLTRAAFDRLQVGAKQSVTLGELVTLQYGKALPATKRRAGRYPVVSSAGIVDSHDTSLVEGPGVVVGRKGTVGSVTWVESDFFPIDTAFYVQSNLPLLYVYWLLKSQDLASMNTDSAVPGLNRENALSLPVDRPDDEAILEFVTSVSPLWSAARDLETEIRELSTMRDELLPLLMSGRVRVREDEVAA